MICLDTNYLIGLVTSPSSLQVQLSSWLETGEKFATSAVAWSEFLNGPLTSKARQDAFGIIEGRILPFDTREAEIAATLFNLIGRKRATQIDCFIAAVAICADSPLATLNRKDFVRFVPAGMRLV